MAQICKTNSSAMRSLKKKKENFMNTSVLASILEKKNKFQRIELTIIPSVVNVYSDT